MPRGVYDRSKSKSKTEATAPVKKAAKAAKATKSYSAKAPAIAAAPKNDITTLRDAISTLTHARQAGAGNTVNTEIDVVLAKAIRQFGESLFPETQVVETQAPAKGSNGAHAVAPAPVAAQVAQAPVAFNPPAPFPQS
jgi:hypothetical protein